MIGLPSFFIKIHLTPKFIPNKDSKLRVDLRISLFTEAYNDEMSFILFT